jgi:hypothetical protein
VLACACLRFFSSGLLPVVPGPAVVAGAVITDATWLRICVRPSRYSFRLSTYSAGVRMAHN